MKKQILLILLLFVTTISKSASPHAGFFLPDSVFEFSMRYKTANNLIILPVVINGTIRVNLILDTGCRNLLLFGKKFEKMFTAGNKPIQFSGLGNGKPLTGKLTLDNQISINAITGNRIPVIIIPERNLFSSFPEVDGVIGYEIFVKFEVELNFSKQLITFRRGSHANTSDKFNYVPMRVVDSKPLIPCKIIFGKSETKNQEILIDTGSSLGLLLSSKENSKKEKTMKIGRGLSGIIQGTQVTTHRLFSNDHEFLNVNTSLIETDDNYASIGLEILKDYIVILNYCKSYAAFQKT